MGEVQTHAHELGTASARETRGVDKLACFISGAGRTAQAVRVKLSHQANITEKRKHPLACVSSSQERRKSSRRNNWLKGNKELCQLSEGGQGKHSWGYVLTEIDSL